MIKIRLYEHPFAPVAPLEFDARSLGEWLLSHYGAAPTVNLQIFAGEPCGENDITGNIEAMLAGDCEQYTILQSPGSAIWVAYAILAVFVIAAIVLMPKPVMPGNVNRTQQSPNNSLGNRQNEVRMYQRVEDIYGTVKSIPSLMMPTYTKYLNNEEFEYGYYCVGRGYYDISEVRDGDTLISDIESASAAIYEPFTSPNGGTPSTLIGDAIIDVILTTRRAIEVDGITLMAINQVGIQPNDRYIFSQNGTNDILTQVSASPNFNSIFEIGDWITITMDDVVDESDPEIIYNYSGDYQITEVGNGFVELDSFNFIADFTVEADLDSEYQPGYTDWITLPAADRTEVWCNVVAPNGLYKDNGGKSVASVGFQLDVEQLDEDLEPTGLVESTVASVTGATQQECAETLEYVTSWVGPARVRMKRTTYHDFAFDGTVQDEIKWADLYSVSPVDREHFGNKTTIHTVTKATARATATKNRQLNCIAGRKIPTYNGTTFSGAFDETGAHVSGTISASSKLADIMAAVSVDPKIGARDLATEVDMPQIWAIQQTLDAWNVEAGQFNYTFDSDNTSYEETVINIANAGFCIAYRQNGKIRFALDQAQEASTALFTHRNKKPNSETITRKFASDSEYDGVEFVYSDPDTQQSETITLPLDGEYTKLKKFEIAGIRSFDQAWLRANREYYKIRGQRITIETMTTLDARALLPNARIDVVDNTRFKSYDGEIVGQAGLELTLSQDVEFTDALAHSIVLMKRDGSLQSIPVTAGSAPNKVILQSMPAEAIVTSYGADGIRTIFSFAADSARGAMAYLVQEIDISDSQYATIRAINYSADYYQMDTEDIPSKTGIIS